MSLLFSRDVVIDLVGYRKFGHNEIDEPMFTQPIMYSIIKKHSNVLDLYSKKLIEQGVSTKEETEAVVDKYEEFVRSFQEGCRKNTGTFIRKSFSFLNLILLLLRFSTNIGWTPPGQGSLKEKIL